MCGFAYLFAPAWAEVLRLQRMRQAVQLIAHRGPDESGIWSGRDCVAGHTRLAIVALDGGHQPLRDPSGRWVLVYNGEIYNYRELRATLTGRWNFRDTSDTEVLLAGLLTEGERFIERLDGMFAFVLRDEHSGELLLARDIFGKKPLYYFDGDGMFACASELPALLALLPERVTEDAAGIADYFRYGYTMPGHTCLSGVEEVMPGHWLRRDALGRIVQRRYWVPSTESWTGSFQQAAAEVRERLVVAVRKRQLAADVEIGAFLSGGVDSTVVCALAGSNGFGQLRTYTAGFAESSFDERKQAARAARELGTLHHAAELSLETAGQLAAMGPGYLGQPFGDASWVPTSMVSALAAREVKVVLTGDGGDEVFGGYARYLGRLLQRRYHYLPHLLRRGLEAVIRAMPEPHTHHSSSLLKRAHLFVAQQHYDAFDYVAPAAMRPSVLVRLLPEPATGYAPPAAPWTQDDDELRQMLLMDWLVWLPQDILCKVDRATMRYGLEARSPFLDRELVEFVLRLPWSWHFSALRGKRLLHAAMRGRVPNFIWQRRKQGFASPVAYWLRGALGDRLQEFAQCGNCGVLEARGVRELLEEHRRGGVDHSQPLWMAYGYLRWRELLNDTKQVTICHA